MTNGAQVWVFDPPRVKAAEPPMTETRLYDEFTVDELRAELKSRDLPSSGTKPDLVARLADDDAEDDDGES